MFTPALVTDCWGALRSLGDEGIPSIVASEHASSADFRSRHCLRRVVVPNMAENAGEVVEILKRVGREFGDRPVAMAGAEADVALLSAYRDELAPYYRIKLAPRELMTALNDKWAFAELAGKHDLPVPRSWRPRDGGELNRILNDLPFPCLLKPPKQGDWRREEVYALIGRFRKALLIDTPAELVRLYEKLSTLTPKITIQEFIPGSDQCLYDLHAYFPEPGRAPGYFLGRKIRTHPIHFGQGCYTRSWNDRSVADVGMAALERLGYVGAANMNLKKDERTGKTYILEINPRFSIWCHLASRCGVNLPLAMYNDCLERPLPKLTQDPLERRWLYVYLDWRSLGPYRRAGDWGVFRWLRSLIFPRVVFYRWDWKDPLPLVAAAWTHVRSRVLWRWERLWKALDFRAKI